MLSVFDHIWTLDVFHIICLLFIQIREICQRAFQWIHSCWQEMATDNLLKVANWNSAHWKASDDTGFVVYVLQLLIMYQSHQVLDSLCSLSLLAPWLPQLTQTVNKVPKQQGLSVPLLIFNNVLPPKNNEKLQKPQTSHCNHLPSAEQSSQLLSHFRSLSNYYKISLGDLQQRQNRHVAFSSCHKASWIVFEFMIV